MTGPANDEGRAPEGDAARPPVTAGAHHDARAQSAPAAPRFEPSLTRLGLELIALAPRSKAPMDRWRDGAPLKETAALSHVACGGNLGVRLRRCDLVIDADPRNYEDDADSLARLRKDFALPETLKVVTGGGGTHLYLRVEDGAALATRLDGYPGLDIKRVGGYVVAPGSVHPDTGRSYALDPLCHLEVAEAPATLVRALTRAEAAETAGSGDVEPEALSEMLDALDPEEFADHDRWLSLMMACHHATGGAGREEFLAWSEGDPAFSDMREENGRRWDSLRAERRGRRFTKATLFKALIAAGRHDLVPPDQAAAASDFEGVELDAPEGALPAPPPVGALPSRAPMAIASAMLEGVELVRSNGDWLRYDGAANSYVEEEPEAFESRVWRWTDGRPYRKGAEVARLTADGGLVSNVTRAATAQRQGPRALPAWHPPRAADPHPEDLLAVRNGLLDLSTRRLLPADPRFVNRNASPVRYDPSAPEPTAWLAFLGQVFPDDQEVRSTLQEVVGYLLTQDTSQQKVFCMVGPPRSGKGTVSRVVQALVGEGNYTSPTAASLSKGEFGLQGLIGKTLATISDMRMGRGTDPSALAENLLRISGEDEVSVNRKFKEPWEGRLGTRFLILSNEVPQFRDTSGAIVSRLILMRGHVSFLGREDPSLFRKLEAELPGILNWALDGLSRLRDRRHFVQPASAVAELRTAVGLASPVKAFAAARLWQDPASTVAKAEVWDAFCQWVADEGLTYTGAMGHFFKDLGTAGLTFSNCRPRVDGERVQSVSGIALAPDD
ncbi:MAG: phage/plasmid primase, P4 family [Bacteroidota bacterium]